MAADLTAIRALLASVGTVHPWRLSADLCVTDRCENGEHVQTLGPMEIVYFDGSDEDGEGYAALSVHPDYADLFAAAPTLHGHLTDLADEVERLRAHNARMVALLNKVADAMDDAEHEAWDDGAEIVTNALPVVGELRALAAGEVSDV